MTFERTLRISVALTLGAVAAALTTPRDAVAAVVNISQDNAALTLQGPYTDGELKISLGMKVGFEINLDVDGDHTSDNLDGMRLYAILFNGGSYVGFRRSAAVIDANPGVVRNQSVELPDGGVDEVTFVYLFETNEAGDQAATDDTLRVNAADPDADAWDANRGGLIIVPLERGEGEENSDPNVGLKAVQFFTANTTPTQYTTNLDYNPVTTAGGATADEIAFIATTIDDPDKHGLSRFPYEGLRLESAMTDSARTAVKLTFNASLMEIASGTPISQSELIIVADTPLNTPVTTVDRAGDGRNVVRVNDGSSNAFLTPVTLAIIPDQVAISQECPNLMDTAGNCANPTGAGGVEIMPFQAPMFAGRTADVLLTGGTCVDDSDEIGSLHSEAGVVCRGGEETLVLTATLAESLAIFNPTDDPVTDRVFTTQTALDAAVNLGIDDNGDIILKAGSTNLEDYITPDLETRPVMPNASANPLAEFAAAGAACVTTTTEGDQQLTLAISKICKFNIQSDVDIRARINPENYRFEFAFDSGDDGPTGFTEVTLALSITREPGEYQIMTGESQTLPDPTDDEPVFTSLSLKPTFETSDLASGKPDGILDGIKIDAKHAIRDEEWSDPGVALVDPESEEDAPGDEITSIVTAVDSKRGIIRVTAGDQMDVLAVSNEVDNSDLSTGTTSMSDPELPYSLRIDESPESPESPIMYEGVYDPTDGELAMLPGTAPDDADIEDGAGPVILSVLFHENRSENGSGMLEVITSEEMKLDGDLQTAGFQIGTSAGSAFGIDFLNLNNGFEQAEISFEVDSRANAFFISPVSKPGEGDKLFLDGRFPTGFVGAIDEEALISPPDGRAIEEGDRFSDDPKILRAFAQMSEDNEFEYVVVVLDSPVEELDGGPGGWTATIDGVDIVFPRDAIEVTGNMVTLMFPGGVKPSVGVVGGWISFERVDEDGDGIFESGLKRDVVDEAHLQNTRGKGVEIEGVNSSGSLFAQKITGTLRGGDLDNAVIHAYVIAEMPVPAGGPNSVCTVRRANSNYTFQLLFEGGERSVKKALRANQRTVDLTLVGELNEARWVSQNLRLSDTNDLGDGTEDVFRLPVTLDVRTGAITAARGSGVQVSNCRLEMARSLMTVSDPSMVILTEANEDLEYMFDMVVGVDENIVQAASGNGNANITGCVFMVAERWRFENENYMGRDVTPFTSCDPAVGSPEEGGNYIGFSPPVVTGGAPSAITVDLSLGDIEVFEIEDGGDWQVASMVGAHRADTGNDMVMVPGLFVCAMNDDGKVEPVSIISEGPTERTDLDELFTLNANGMRSFVEVGGTTAFNTLRNSDVGENFAFAFRQESNGEGGMCAYMRKDGATGSFDLGRGWTLAKVGSDCGSEVTGVIVVQNDGATKVGIGENVDSMLEIAGAGGGGVVAFIYSPDGMENFNSCSLSL